jgi:hypothetical protein
MIMKQLTIRGLTPELERSIRAQARQQHTSLNRAALYLLNRGAGLSDASLDCVGDSLDGFIGSWSPKEAQQFDETVAVFDTVDQEFWQ